MKSRWFLKVVSAGIVLASACVAGDYLLLARPEQYAISNQYEQPLTASEKAAFKPYSPFRVIDQDMVLGDQINKALKFEFQNKNYFLLKNENGSFSGEVSADTRKRFSNCELINDTIQVTRDGVLAIAPIAGVVRMAAAHETIVRIFKLGTRYYLQTAAGYGWSSLEPATAWRKNRRAAEKTVSLNDTGLSSEICTKIDQRVALVNETYIKYYQHFNEQTKTEKTPPVWTADRNAGALRYMLAGPASDQFGESSKKLLREIENLLVGSSYRAIGSRNEIVIQKR
ncbi:MAG: hypothetical protein MUF22_05290 [Chitinispirillaceae bacterium]|jgi:hypothetical protein|nr:hypothetical protein [Chitinispirillaceae bacterium]